MDSTARTPQASLSLRPLIVGTLAVAFAVTVSACGEPFFPDAPRDDSILEGPIAGLTAPQHALFLRGDAEFGRAFAATEGLGPLFIAQSCDACHAGDGKGHPVFDITRFGRYDGATFDPMIAYGGPQLQNRAILSYLAETRPSESTVMARFTPPAVTGLGLLEAVDDSSILALADSADLNGDGISGRASWVTASPFIDALAAEGVRGTAGTPARHLSWSGRYLGRFGKKATTITLRHQTVNAYSEDMGLTTDDHPDDLVLPGLPGSSGDGVTDPEVGSGIVSSVVFYLRTLRPPPRRDAANPEVVAGRQRFIEVGCANCHVMTMRTGRSSIAALDRIEFEPLTDLLLHDMGSELDDGYTEGNSSSSEWRTAPLWGIGLAERATGGTQFLLHDGRARSLRAAIGFHGGEASASRAAFNALTAVEQERLLRYLRSL